MWMCMEISQNWLSYAFGHDELVNQGVSQRLGIASPEKECVDLYAKTRAHNVLNPLKTNAGKHKFLVGPSSFMTPNVLTRSLLWDSNPQPPAY